MRGREEREERPDEVEESGEAGLEAEDEPVDVDRAAPHLDGLAEELRARERAVDDVEVDGGREDQDEERREREVRDERPARRGLAEDFLDAGGQGSHVLLLRRGAGRQPGGVGRPNEIDEHVLEARAQRRELREEDSARADAVDDGVQLREVARRELEVAVDARDVRARLRGPTPSRRSSSGDDRHPVARRLGRQLRDRPLRDDLARAQDRDAVAGAARSRRGGAS